jgi:hypothetical protein
MEIAARPEERLGERTLNAIEDEIAELAANIHAATCRLLQLIYTFDANCGWRGWLSCGQWLSWRTDYSLEAAREKVRVARALPGLPKITAAFEKGEISYSEVRAMTRVASRETEEFFLQMCQRTLTLVGLLHADTIDRRTLPRSSPRGRSSCFASPIAGWSLGSKRSPSGSVPRHWRFCST